VGAEGDPAVFRSMLERALSTSPTPWALLIQRLPTDLAPWDLEDHAGCATSYASSAIMDHSAAMRT
jgi:hypothetical protein